MKLPRRSFLTATALTAARLSLGAAPETASSKPPAEKKRVKLGLSSYSYWHFRPPKVSIETVIDKAAELEIVSFSLQRPGVSAAEPRVTEIHFESK